MEQVSWFEVAAFCNALSRLEGRDECYVFTPRGSITGDDVTWPRGLDCTGYRLPTEAEWEYAGRAGTQSAWFCGEDEDCLRGVAWYKRNSKPTTHPVGEKAANAWGLHDMAGNVLEWVWDWWPGDYAQDRVDPTGPSAGAYRMIRNGSWGSPSLQLRADYRNSIHPTVSLDSLGFRLARSLP